VAGVAREGAARQGADWQARARHESARQARLGAPSQDMDGQGADWSGVAG